MKIPDADDASEQYWTSLLTSKFSLLFIEHLLARSCQLHTRILVSVCEHIEMVA